MVRKKMIKTNQFRTGQKAEIGFDLDKDAAGYQPGNGKAWTTLQGELLSNYTETNAGGLGPFTKCE
jgi:hypothetical protein